MRVVTCPTPFAGVRLARGEWREALGTLELLVSKEDLREDAYRVLMDVLARNGQRDRALRHYDRLVALLRDELDAEPEPQTSALAQRIRGAEILASAS